MRNTTGRVSVRAQKRRFDAIKATSGKIFKQGGKPGTGRITKLYRINIDHHPVRNEKKREKKVSR